MCKICWSIVLLLSLICAGVIYKFVVQGNIAPVTDPMADKRTAIQLESAERDLVLSEMRIFLQSVQQITSGIVNENMQQVIQQARLSGRSAQQEMPGSLVEKLPLPFKKLGFDTHSKFDQLALDAEQLGDPDHTLSQLATLMENCVSCHATYRFSVAP
ncbi:MAG: hypothetical protein V3W04_11110 [Gammaproteobacteria bacterium]